MFCNKCGHALPSVGFICNNCGALMSPEQIKEQKKHLEEKKKEVTLLTDRYNVNKSNVEYRKTSESKYLGIIFIVLVVIILIIIAILKVM